jgi:hypothetical protein
VIVHDVRSEDRSTVSERRDVEQRGGDRHDSMRRVYFPSLVLRFAALTGRQDVVQVIV